jgi:D-methionine transport system substrate-binding protein
MTNRYIVKAALMSAMVASAALSLQSASAASETVRVGIISGEDEDVWRVVAANAAKKGLTVKVTSFSDYTQPNEALASHDVDANAFQHQPYLDAQIKAKGYKITAVGYTYVQPIGLYSQKVKSVAAIRDGAVIGVPNDPSNEARALKLLQAQNLITLSNKAGVLATVTDIATNPKHLKIKELDAGVIGRSIVDLDAAVVNTDWAIKAGIKIPQERIAQEKTAGNPYRNFIAVNTSDVNASWVKPLVQSYQQPNVAAEIEKVYHGATIPAWDGAPH